MRWQGIFALPILWLVACQDSGKVPFTDGKLFEQGSTGGASFGGSGGGSSSSCKGYCGTTSERPSGCYCDDNCSNSGDCCADWYDVCSSGSGGSGGSGGQCFAGTYDSCENNSDCCGYPSNAVCVNFSTVGTYCAPRCDFDSDCEENCCRSTKQGNYVCHPSSTCN